MTAPKVTLSDLLVSDEIADAYRRGYDIGRQVGRNQASDDHDCPKESAAVSQSDRFFARSDERFAQGDIAGATRLEQVAIRWLRQSRE